MSHFTVLVIGPDPEKQLAPYHEFECTGHDDEYVVDVDVTEEVKAQMSDGTSLDDALGYFGLDEKIVDDEAVVERDGPHKYGYAVVRDGALVKAVDRTNPNRKWDWYQLGGRWTGFFTLKTEGAGVSGIPGLMTAQNTDPNRADSTFKRHIDFAGMRDAAEARARVKYARFQNVIAGCAFPETFKQVIARVGDVEQARTFYWAQPAMRRLNDARDFTFCEPGDFAVTIDEFAKKARDQAIATFAVVKDGKWYETGAMGWWGHVSDKKDVDVWLTEFNKLVDDAPDDTLLSVFDCHHI